MGKLLPGKPTLCVVLLAAVSALFYLCGFNIREKWGVQNSEWANASARGIHVDFTTENTGIEMTERTLEDTSRAGNTSTAQRPGEHSFPWHEFGLFVRMHHRTHYLYQNTLLMSMKLFWFLPVDLAVVLDDTPEDRTLGKEISGKYPLPRIWYEQKIDPEVYHNNGWNLQQLSMFYADKYVTKKYIGCVDTDTLFVTAVTPELMFYGTKPRVIGQYGVPVIPVWGQKTQFVLGRNEVFHCMDYFPVIMKVEHIIEMRHYIEKLHNMSFLDVFQTISDEKKSFSQFNIMCNYMWYFHREEYQFHVQFRKTREPWNEETNTVWRQPLDYYTQHITDDMKFPIPRSSIHSRYYPHWNNSGRKMKILRTGVCFSGGFTICPQLCTHLNSSSLHRELFMFDNFKGVDWSWDPHCAEAHRQHYLNIAHQHRNNTLSLIEKGCNTLIGKTNVRPHRADKQKQ